MFQMSPQPPDLTPPSSPSPFEGNTFRVAKDVAAMLPDWCADEQQPWPEGVEQGWVERMQGKVEQLLDRPSSVHSVATIFRVPDHLRRSNPDAYKPVFISLGPYHRHPAKVMDKYKAPYRKDLLRRIWPEMTNEDLAECFEIELQILRRVPDLEDRARACYFKAPLETNPEGKEIENAVLPTEKLAEMLILDACFVVEFLFKFSASKNGITNYYEDPVIGDRCRRDDVIRDMLLLENQIPFFILQQVLDIALGKAVDHRLPSSSPFLYLFEERWPILPYSPPAAHSGEGSSVSATADDPHHLLHLFRRCMLPHLLFFQEEDYHRYDVVLSRSMIPSATKLHAEAIITFSGFRKGENIRSLGFHNGIIKLPPLTLSNESDTVFRNLIALEQGHPESGHQVTSYVVFMYALVKTQEDIDLLQHCGILKNSLVGYDRPALFFHNIIEDSTPGYNRGKLYTDIAKYCKYSLGLSMYWKSRWPAWLQELKESYLRSPWTVIGIAGASLILLFTVVQTICTLISTIKG